MHSNAYTFRFAATVTIICSVLLAGAATLLKPRQVENERLDKKKNILISAGISGEAAEFTRVEINSLYDKYILGFVADTQGNLLEGKTPDTIDPKTESGLLPLYEYKVDDQVKAFIVPVSGKGLWSTIYGYLALEADCKTVKGITFYKHGETPGLGGEISKEWFTNNFKGKSIYNEAGELVSIGISKGKYHGSDVQHYVDGISGATLTGRGVEKFLKIELKKYNPFFAKARKAEGGKE